MRKMTTFDEMLEAELRKDTSSKLAEPIRDQSKTPDVTPLSDLEKPNPINARKPPLRGILKRKGTLSEIEESSSKPPLSKSKPEQLSEVPTQNIAATEIHIKDEEEDDFY